ncbi:putative toxin [Pseudomonas sp. KNUC1026]|uniref:putative toxin n=1 Tax=Pseudomonas sp. KNUC1026 TaxID=2893890 RepID=UPI001F168CC7|nr:putative toxin [Pseudomonas sp. KNUC1026]UFH49293.1 hypothetical protein LN139_20885 [Pseudomonas sp. KNUC1026]
MTVTSGVGAVLTRETGVGCILAGIGFAAGIDQYRDGLNKIADGFTSEEGKLVLASLKPETFPEEQSLTQVITSAVVDTIVDELLTRVGGKLEAVASKEAKAEADRLSKVDGNGTPVDKFSQIMENRQNGSAFEKQVIDAFEHVGGEKNNTPITVQLPNGKEVKTYPDMWGRNSGGILEVKNIRELSMSDQLRAQLELSEITGQPFNLVVSPRTQRISAPLQARIDEVTSKVGGGIYRYDPSIGELSKF